MRIVIVNKYAHLTGGADQHCIGLAEGLVERGHEVRFLSTSSEQNVVHDGVFVPANVTHDSRDSLTLAEQARVLRRSIWNPGAANGTRRLLADFQPDIVHTHKLYPQLSVAPVVVASRAGVPIVQTLHDFEMISASPIDARGGWWDRDETRMRYKILNSASRPVHSGLHAPRVAAFIAVSRFVARVHRRHGIEATVLPNFISFDVPTRAQLPGFDERRGIVFVGRLRPEKGANDIVPLARRIPGIPVSIVGSGDLQAELADSASHLDNLDLLGFLPNDALPGILRRARVVVIPSRCQEAASIVSLEAMAHGTPVVAYAMGGLAEYVTDAEGGLIVPVDVDSLAAAASKLHEDRVAWEALSLRGHTAVRERHTSVVYAERLEHVYLGALATTGRHRRHFPS